MELLVEQHLLLLVLRKLMLDFDLFTSLIFLTRQSEEYDASAEMIVELQVLGCLAVGN